MPRVDRRWKKGCHIQRRSHGKQEDPISGPLISNKPAAYMRPTAKYRTSDVLQAENPDPEQHWYLSQAGGYNLLQPWRCQEISAVLGGTSAR